MRVTTHGESTGAMGELLLTGFGPHLTVAVNPSGELARRFDGRRLGSLTVAAHVLSVSVARAPDELTAAVRGRRPRLIVGLGVQREPNWRFERRARLPLTATKADVDGHVPSEHPTDVSEEWSTDCDLDRCVALLRSHGVAARTSDDAGGYVCEWAYVHLLRHARALSVPALFVHVPPIEAMALDDQAVVLERLLTHLAR